MKLCHCKKDPRPFHWRLERQGQTMAVGASCSTCGHIWFSKVWKAPK